jgi:hypothetical protein
LSELDANAAIFLHFVLIVHTFPFVVQVKTVIFV